MASRKHDGDFLGAVQPEGKSAGEKQNVEGVSQCGLREWSESGRPGRYRAGTRKRRNGERNGNRS